MALPLPPPDPRNRQGKNIAAVTGPNLEDRLNPRAPASETAAILGKYFAGTQVEVPDDNATGAFGREQTWYRVKVGGKQGYMRAAWLQDLQTGDLSTW